MADKTKTVVLLEPIDGPRGSIAEVVLRSPSYGAVMELGDPEMWSRSRDGSVVRVVDWPVVAAYVDRCLVEPQDPLVLRAMTNLTDITALQEAVLDFFSAARAARRRIDASRESSSSASVGTPAPSSA